MFEDTSGRFVRSVGEAESYIWKFIAENLTASDHHIRERSHDFDLYLPWLLEILEYLKVDRAEALPIIELQKLYMEAAWSLVLQGFLRPGPRTITGDAHNDGYGKGYSLTEKGRLQMGPPESFLASIDSMTPIR